MQETRLVQVLMELGRRKKFSWRITNNDCPITNFTDMRVEIHKKDLILYHVAHELAHIYIGACASAKEEPLHEILAEQIAVEVKAAFGYERTADDQEYIRGWARYGKITKAAIKNYEAYVLGISASIVKETRRIYDASYAIGGSGKPVGQYSARVQLNT